MQVFVACGIGSGSGKSEEDPFRKPKPGMWHIMENHFNGGIPVNLDQLFISPSLYFTYYIIIIFHVDVGFE